MRKDFEMFLRFNWKIVYKGFLGLFTFCGFCPIVINDKRKGLKFEVINIILIIWSLLHIAVLGTLVYIGSSEFLDEESDLDGFNNILKFSAMSITYFLACVESIAVRKNFIEIWIRIKSTDEMIGSMLPEYAAVLKTFYKKTARKIVLYLIFTFVMEFAIITNITPMKNWSFMWYISIVPLTMSRMRHLQHTLYIDLLTHRFQVIKQELKLIVKLTKLKNNKLVTKNFVFYDGLFRKINTIKKVYNILWETSLFTNRSFGVSQLANLLQNFVQLTCDLYLVYSFLYHNNLVYILGNY